jgi:hypothetical protein
VLPVGTSGGTANLHRVSRGTSADGTASLATEASLCAHPGWLHLLGSCAMFFPCSTVNLVLRQQLGIFAHACAEEVYACEFLEAMDGRLCTASDTSLFLWDLAAAVLVQRCSPPSVQADKRLGESPAKYRD